MSSLTSALAKIQRENIQPAVVQKESNINFSSAGKAWRGVGFAKFFTVVFEGKFIAKYAAKYAFAGATSSGYRFFIDGKMISFR